MPAGPDGGVTSSSAIVYSPLPSISAMYGAYCGRTSAIEWRSVEPGSVTGVSPLSPPSRNSLAPLGLESITRLPSADGVIAIEASAPPVGLVAIAASISTIATAAASISATAASVSVIAATAASASVTATAAASPAVVAIAVASIMATAVAASVVAPAIGLPVVAG